MSKAKSQPRRTITRNPLPIIFALLAVAAGAILAAKLLTTRPADAPTPSQPQSESETPSSPSVSPSQEDSTTHTPTTKDIPQYDGDDPNASDTITGYANYTGVSGQNYAIRVIINQYLTSGTCRLEFSGNDTTHTGEAAIIPSATSSTCEGFDIPLKALGTGTYIYNIYITSGDRSGTISGEVSL